MITGIVAGHHACNSPVKETPEERLWLEPRDKGRHCPAQTQGERGSPRLSRCHPATQGKPKDHPVGCRRRPKGSPRPGEARVGIKG